MNVHDTNIEKYCGSKVKVQPGHGPDFDGKLRLEGAVKVKQTLYFHSCRGQKETVPTTSPLLGGTPTIDESLESFKRKYTSVISKNADR